MVRLGCLGGGERGSKAKARIEALWFPAVAARSAVIAAKWPATGSSSPSGDHALGSRTDSSAAGTENSTTNCRPTPQEMALAAGVCNRGYRRASGFVGAGCRESRSPACDPGSTTYTHSPNLNFGQFMPKQHSDSHANGHHSHPDSKVSRDSLSGVCCRARRVSLNSGRADLPTAHQTGEHTARHILAHDQARPYQARQAK